MAKTALIPIERIQKKIILLRGRKVMMDSDLAELYRVETRTLVQAVKRNIDRFPEDFLFHLTDRELRDWRSQIVISNPSAKMGLRRKPYAFTEQGVAMLSSVLRSKTAVLVNVQIMRSFVKLRELLQSNEALSRRLTAIELQVDAQGQAILSIMKELESPKTSPKKRPIGFGRG